MAVTATDAKNRFGQLLELAQRGPVVIEKAGRRHSVLLSAEEYDRLVAARQSPRVDVEGLNPAARAFYEKYRDWMDEQHRDFGEHGVWNEEFRAW
ncbi:MAG: type II toxin-antitoxin system Phd/YefM family antitoxin [Rubrivivax sp.]|jgi:prevent-host-death family protein|nr:type II toxin-antitoxin system Phd/YefM family antitoxin [Rubrivivax sp.]